MTSNNNIRAFSPRLSVPFPTSPYSAPCIYRASSFISFMKEDTCNEWLPYFTSYDSGTQEVTALVLLGPSAEILLTYLTGSAWDRFLTIESAICGDLKVLVSRVFSI